MAPDYRVTLHARARCLERWGFEMSEKDGRRLFDDIAAGRAVRLREDERDKGECWEITCRAYVMVVIVDLTNQCVLTVKPRREWHRPKYGGKGAISRKKLDKKQRRRMGISDR